MRFLHTAILEYYPIINRSTKVVMLFRFPVFIS